MVKPAFAGAEAILVDAQRHGRAVLEKRRVVKGYRHALLDQRLRDQRTRDEAGLLLAARRAGVPVPVVYDIDRGGATLAIEKVDGLTLRELLASDDLETASLRLVALGRHVARLHEAGITHGDLTTSNVLVPGPEDLQGLVLIDFGLGQWTQEDEPRGVDLHLLEEALEATDPRAEALLEAFLTGYAWAGAQAVRARLDAIRERGRYR